MRPAHSRNPSSRASLIVIVAVLFLWQQGVLILFPQTLSTKPHKAPQLKIVVLAGKGGVNIIETKTAVEPVVEVRDEKNLPVAGAHVVFAAPETQAHVTFAHGSFTYTTITDARGRAAVHVIRPIGLGRFEISVTVSLKDQTVTTAIRQTNYATVAAAKAATAAAAGAAVAPGKSEGGSRPAPAPVPSGTIGTPGTPNVGPPK